MTRKRRDGEIDCIVCGYAHHPREPHNHDSGFYRSRFRAAHRRMPTWADALAHCPAVVREWWERELKKRNAWTEPAAGEPIDEPPGEWIGNVNPNHED